MHTICISDWVRLSLSVNARNSMLYLASLKLNQGKASYSFRLWCIKVIFIWKMSRKSLQLRNSSLFIFCSLLPLSLEKLFLCNHAVENKSFRVKQKRVKQSQRERQCNGSTLLIHAKGIKYCRDMCAVGIFTNIHVNKSVTHFC